MTIYETIKMLESIKNQQEKLKAERTALEDTLRAHMDSLCKDETITEEYKMSYKAHLQHRFDSKAFEKDEPSLFNKYCKESVQTKLLYKSLV